MSRMQRSLFAELNALAEEISAGAEKIAAEKAAAPCPADPGGYKGPSSHPSASADNNCQPASEGERSRENESDVKDQQGSPSVDNTPEMSYEGRQDDVQLNIGTHAAATGEDPAAEKDFKGTKDDPGTSHPAKTNDGEKYSAVSFKEARAKCTDLANEVLTHLVTAPAEKEAELHGDQHKLDVDNDGKIEGEDLAKLRSGKTKKKEDAPAVEEKKSEAAEATEESTAEEQGPVGADKQAYDAGYELAAAMEWEKEAAEASVQELCANTLRETDEMAEAVIGWLDKQAEADIDDVANAEDHSEPADALSGAGDSPEAAMTDAADTGAAEEMPMEEAPSDDESIQELAMALEELGIPPEALLGALSEEGGELPPEAGAEEMPKIAADKTASELNLIGRAVINFKRSGNFQVKEARTKRSRLLRDEMKQHVLELVNR